MLVYVDTNVYLNILKQEPYAAIAERLILQSLSCRFKIAFSDWVGAELAKQVDPGKVLMMLNLLHARGKLVSIKTEPSDEEELARFTGQNPDDYRHALLARKVNADVLVTRNMKDFRAFSHIIEAKLPEDI